MLRTSSSTSAAVWARTLRSAISGLRAFERHELLLNVGQSGFQRFDTVLRGAQGDLGAIKLRVLASQRRILGVARPCA
jgi:hypothetical protein